jgi:hypothetical protein
MFETTAVEQQVMTHSKVKRTTETWTVESLELPAADVHRTHDAINLIERSVAVHGGGDVVFPRL